MKKELRHSCHSQRGFLSIVAVLLIVVIGFLGVAIAYMVVGSASATNNFAQAENALYLSNAGAEQAARLLLTPVLTGTNGRISCSGLTGNSNLTNKSFGSGTFTVTNTSGSPYYVNAILASSITATASTITVDSTAGFAPAGRIVIDNEVINYGGISGNSFVGIQRGANFNYNTPHASGAAVAQYQCDLDVVAGIPNLTSPLYKRDIQQSFQMQEAWAVGNLSGSNLVLTRWNRPTMLAWNSSLVAATPVNLNAVSMLSNADGWIVGNTSGTTFVIRNWDGATWTAVSAPAACSGQNLTGVSAVYHQEAWAVGTSIRTNGTCSSGGGTRRYTVLYWNGSSWAILTPATTISIPADNSSNQNLNAVHVIDSTQSGAGNLGFAVGNAGRILKYNGSTWTAMTSPTTRNLFGVYVVSASEAWAVGASGAIIKWNGTSWSNVTSPTTTQLNEIFMVDADLSGTANAGWAVGNGGVAVTYNGSSWSSNNSGSGSNLFGVAMFLTNAGQDVWAVGASGTIRHYDGTAWAAVSSGVTQQLNAISVIAPQQYPYAWQENYA